MSDTEATEYLNALIGDRIPGHEQMTTQEFFEQIQKQYEQNGIRFHCYLRENFFNPLQAKEIKKAQPTLLKAAIHLLFFS